MCGNMGSGGSASSGGTKGNSSADYNSHGDYIKTIDVSQFKTDYGTLPELQGSEKQRTWAEQIRKDTIESLDKEMLNRVNNYNNMVSGRNQMTAKGESIPENWGKITKQEYENTITYTKSQKDKAHELAVKSVAEFYKQNPKASTVIDTRQYIPTQKLAKAFRNNPDKMTSIEQGVKYIIRDIAKEGYNTSELVANYKKKFNK